jgi:hypothetical protein
MSFILHPWQLFFLILSGLANRQQQKIIEFQNAQIQAHMGKLCEITVPSSSQVQWEWRWGR